MSLLEAEEWRPIPGWEGLYDASSLGRIRSHDRVLDIPGCVRGYPRTVRGRVLRPRAAGGSRRYLMVGLSNKHRQKSSHYVAHLVALAFIGPKPTGVEVCHNDGNSTNNRVANLRYDTRKGNENDKLDHGTRLFGEDCPSSVLHEEDVRRIRRISIFATVEDVAMEFNITPFSVTNILVGRTWSHLPLMDGEVGPGTEAAKIRQEVIRESRRARMSARWEGVPRRPKLPPKKTNKPVLVDGIYYSGMKAAGRALGITRSAIYRRIRSGTGRARYVTHAEYEGRNAEAAQ